MPRKQNSKSEKKNKLVDVTEFMEDLDNNIKNIREKTGINFMTYGEYCNKQDEENEKKIDEEMIDLESLKFKLFCSHKNIPICAHDCRKIAIHNILEKLKLMDTVKNDLKK